MMGLLVSSLVMFLTVGLYFMTGQVVRVQGERPARLLEPAVTAGSRADAWPDFNRINWGSSDGRVWSTPRATSTERSSSPGGPSLTGWSAWSAWSRCNSRPCLRGQTTARSRACTDRQGRDSDMKICVKQGGLNVEIEPCFCFR